MQLVMNPHSRSTFVDLLPCTELEAAELAAVSVYGRQAVLDGRLSVFITP